MMESAWKTAARAWWERMREAERERDEMRVDYRELSRTYLPVWEHRNQMQKRAWEAERLCDELRDDLSSLIQTRAEERVGLLQNIESLETQIAERESVHQHHYEVRQRMEANLEEVMRERDELLQKLEGLQKAAESSQKEPSGNPGEFADLAARIAEADEKHPRDSEDGGRGSMRDAKRALFDARNTLEENPMWSNALWCEAEEVMCDLAAKDFDGVCSELLDVATVAMRWRRAVMERAK